MPAKKSAPAAEATDPRGLKRICAKCSTRYYDFGARPPICPSCGETFVVPTGGRPKRAATAEPEAEAKKEEAAEKVPATDDEDAVLVATADDAEKAVENDDVGDDATAGLTIQGADEES